MRLTPWHRRPRARELAHRSGRARFAARVAGAACAAALAAASTAAASSARPRATAVPNTPVTVSGARLGPSFQGIGAISGGGGNSRYLIDYPARQRAAILDYLFRPNYGAALQLLKIEIGGNGNSSDGSEPSIEQVHGAVNCRVGYEFWLAEQAVRRNPHIALYGLQWSAPGWVRGKANTLWTANDISYLLDWLGCARRAGLRISYLGGWNEHYTPGSAVIADWYVALRHALDAHGYGSVQIVAADNYGIPAAAAWSVAADAAANRAFGQAISAVGVHDVCGIESHGFSCTGAPAAQSWSARTDKPLLQSELGRTPRAGRNPLEEGPASLARIINHEYIDAGVTGTLLWPMVEAMPPDLPFSGRGLIAANQPWSGNYSVSPLVWVVAHTTAFTARGWRFVRGANGMLTGGGSYVTYAAPDRSAWSTVVETTTAHSTQSLELHVSGGLPTHVRVWQTGLGAGQKLAPVATLTARDATVRYRLAPDALYTFTTTSGQPAAGVRPPAVPAARPLGTRYTASPDAAGMAWLLAPMEGSFQYVAGTLTQVAVGHPVPWSSCDVPFPYAVLGRSVWRRYTVSAKVALPATVRGGASSGAFLIAGYTGLGTPCDFAGYLFSVDASGRWKLTRNSDLAATLAGGRVRAALSYTLSLAVAGDLVVGRVDGRTVVRHRARAPIGGLAGLGSLTYTPVRYQQFTIR